MLFIFDKILETHCIMDRWCSHISVPTVNSEREFFAHKVRENGKVFYSLLPKRASYNTRH